MTMSTMQPDVHTLTGAYVCDALDPQERAAFEEHLTECVTCRQEVAELREVAAALGAAAVAKPPDTLKLIVDASITVTRQLPPVVTPITAAPSVRKRNRAAWAGWIVAAALAGVVAGQAVYEVHQSRSYTTVSQQAEAMAQLLDAPDVSSSSKNVSTGGMGLVVASRSRGEAAIALAGLAVPPSGKVYQLWLIGPDGARSAGVVSLAGGASGPLIAYGLDDATSVGLTVEPRGGSAHPTSTPILLLPVA
jgi:anti-sigma-K factor RskA